MKIADPAPFHFRNTGQRGHPNESNETLMPVSTVRVNEFICSSAVKYAVTFTKISGTLINSPDLPGSRIQVNSKFEDFH